MVDMFMDREIEIIEVNLTNIGWYFYILNYDILSDT
jgi:hypothetical protein